MLQNNVVAAMGTTTATGNMSPGGSGADGGVNGGLIGGVVTALVVIIVGVVIAVVFLRSVFEVHQSVLLLNCSRLTLFEANIVPLLSGWFGSKP